MKRLFFPLIIVAVAAAWLIATRTGLQVEVSSSPATSAEENTGESIDGAVIVRAKVMIDYGDKPVVTGERPVTDSDTALSMLTHYAQTARVDLKTKQYDFGVMVESVDGYQNTKDKAWIYYLNGQSGQVAADQQRVKPGDLVEWKYVKPE